MSSNETNNENIDVSDASLDAESSAEIISDESVEVSTDSETAALQEEVTKYKDQFVRAQAEMENVRRRAEVDISKAHKFALEKFTKELLPVVDSLEKSVESVGEDAQVAVIKEGIDLTLSMLTNALGKFNVEQIDPTGEPFDPQVHEAMSMVEAPGAEPNSVVAVMQKGYLLNGRLVRPAMVMVSKAAASGSQIDEQA